MNSNNYKSFKRFVNKDRIIQQIQSDESHARHLAQATTQGDQLIQIIYKDTTNNSYSDPVWVKRAAVAKLYSLKRVEGSINGYPIVLLHSLDNVN